MHSTIITRHSFLTRYRTCNYKRVCFCFLSEFFLKSWILFITEYYQWKNKQIGFHAPLTIVLHIVFYNQFSSAKFCLLTFFFFWLAHVLSLICLYSSSSTISPYLSIDKYGNLIECATGTWGSECHMFFHLPELSLYWVSKLNIVV